MRWMRSLAALTAVAAGLTLAAPFAAAAEPAAAARGGGGGAKSFEYFSFLNDPQYGSIERIALWVVLAVAVAGPALRRRCWSARCSGPTRGPEDAGRRQGDPPGGQRLPRPAVPRDHPPGAS